MVYVNLTPGKDKHFNRRLRVLMRSVRENNGTKRLDKFDKDSWNFVTQQRKRYRENPSEYPVWRIKKLAVLGFKIDPKGLVTNK